MNQITHFSQIDFTGARTQIETDMEHAVAGPAPTDAYQWRESVLSTRSLSYISNAPDDHEIPFFPAGRRGSGMRSGSYGLPPLSHTRRNTLMSISSLGEDEETLDLKLNQHKSNSQPSTPHAPLQEDPQEESPEVPVLPLSIAKSRLFLLPLELRQIIWSYALSPSDPNLVIPWPSTHLTSHLQPQLLRTCKAIYEESADVLYTTTNLSFVHPSDANMFRRALASQEFASLLPHFTLQIKSSDAKLWTAWFNSNSQERSLVKDFPHLQSLSIRYQGLRYDPRYTEEQNAHMWLKDPRLQEVVLSVRKCTITARGGPPIVRVALCVVLPDEIQKGLQEGRVDANQAAEKVNSVIFVREAWLLGCFIKVELISREGPWP